MDNLQKLNTCMMENKVEWDMQVIVLHASPLPFELAIKEALYSLR
jgi:hypothetical protein